MAIPALSITKQYQDGRALTEAQLDAAYDSIETWAALVAGSAVNNTDNVNISGIWTFAAGSLLVSGAGAGDATLQYANSANDRTITFPDPGGNDSVVYLAATQTLTNKTLTAPTITGSIGGTPTIPSPTLSGTIAGSPTVNGTWTSGNWTLAGTIAGTPTFSGVVTHTAEVVLPDVDPPTANRLNRNGVIKAWAVVANSGAASLTDGYNITSVNRLGVGRVTVTFATDFANATYCAVACTLTGANLYATIESKAAGSCIVDTRDDTGSSGDRDFSLMVIGDQ